MNPRYPRGYRKSDERYQDLLDYEQYNKFNPLKSQVPKDSLEKMMKGTLCELKDPLRKAEKVIRKEEVFDLQLDMYLFSKGKDINS